MTILFIIFILLAIFILNIVSKTSKPSDKEIQDQLRAEDSDKFRKFMAAQNQMIYKQFKGYTDNLFLDSCEINQEVLKTVVSRDFPYYYNGRSFKLLVDLMDAGLIEPDDKRKVYQKGYAYFDINLNYPAINELLNTKRKEDFRTAEYGYSDINAIEKSIDHYLTYFSFGISKGTNDLIRSELIKANRDISKESAYLFTKTYRRKYVGGHIDNKLIYFEALDLEKDFSVSKYRDIFDIWFAKSLDALKSFEF